MHFTSQELSSQPLPTKDSTDDRYEMLLKLQGLLKTLGYRGILVLVDRVDEPHLIAKMPDHDLWMTFFRDPEGNTLALMSEVRASA